MQNQPNHKVLLHALKLFASKELQLDCHAMMLKSEPPLTERLHLLWQVGKIFLKRWLKNRKPISSGTHEKSFPGLASDAPSRTNAVRCSGTGTGGQLPISAKIPSFFQLFRLFLLPPLEKDNFRLYSTISDNRFIFTSGLNTQSIKCSLCPTFSSILIKNF